jgi:uncharacterized protein
MKPSRFNIFIPLPSENGSDYLLFNTFTDTRVRINEALKSFMDRIDRGEPASQDEQPYLDQLLELGLMRPDAEDEDCLLGEWFERVRYDQSELSLTLLTTYACNLLCSYCYQDGIKSWSSMDLATCERLIEWAGRLLTQIEPGSLRLTFYGGEPLLNTQALFFLARNLFNETRRRGITQEIHIITNGTLLSRKLVEYLRPFGLKSIKVTLDGDREAHDRQRPFADGRGTFELICHNLENIKGGVSLIIGGNYDLTNKGSIPRLLDRLAERDFCNYIQELAFKPIIGAGRPTCSFSDSSPEDFLWLIEETEKKGFSATKKISLGPCEAQKAWSFTIDPEGRIYKCGAFVGRPEFEIGNIRQSIMNGAHQQFMTANPRWGNNCKGCPYIPLCCGGCRYSAYLKGGDIRETSCERVYLEKVALNLIARDYLRAET